MTPERAARIRAVLSKRQPDLTVVTDYVHKGRNLSAIVRTADAVGVMEVHCALGDQDYKRYRGTSMGSHSWVDVHCYADVREPLLALKAQGYQLVATHLSSQSVDFHRVDYTKPTALLLGAEKEGLSEVGVQLADVLVRIPMVGMVESLNVSVAAGIILSHVQYQRQQQGLYARQRIDQQTHDRLFFEWAHEKVRDFCNANRLEYPPLREDGEIDNPSAWYQQVRQLIQNRAPTDQGK